MVHIAEGRNETEKPIRKMIRRFGSGLHYSIQMVGILDIQNKYGKL